MPGGLQRSLASNRSSSSSRRLGTGLALAAARLLHPQTAATTATGVLARSNGSQAHPDQVQLLVRNEPGYSYPSGHTTRGRLCALILAELDPSQRGHIVSVAERVGIDRIMAGEHYQTDIAAGRRLAKILFQILNKNQQFQAELATVKAAEWNVPPSHPTTPMIR